MYKHRKLTRVVLVALFVAQLLFLLVSWWGSSKTYLQSEQVALILIAFGRIAGLVGVLFALMQFVLVARIPLLERSFGQDRLSLLHRLTGYVTFIFISIHPVLIVNGSALLSGNKVPNQYLLMIQTYEGVIFAVLGLLCLYALVLSSIYLVRRHLRYEWWRTVHMLSYLFIALSFIHQLKLGATVLSDQVFNYYWLGIYTVVFALFGYYRVLVPIATYMKHRFVVARVVNESPTATSVYITGRVMSSYHWKSGQFSIFTFIQKGIPLQSHPFSISYAPQGKDEIRITVKNVGDYTSKIATLKPGSRVLIQGPYGIFGQQVELEKQVLLVAGGIGITPLRALFERYARHGRDVILIFAAQKPEDFVLHKELDAVVKTYSNAKVIYVCEGLVNDPRFVEGRITKELLHNYVPNIPGRRAFVCGPPAMMKAVEQLLLSAHMPKDKIFSERFSFLRKN